MGSTGRSRRLAHGRRTPRPASGSGSAWTRWSASA